MVRREEPTGVSCLGFEPGVEAGFRLDFCSIYLPSSTPALCIGLLRDSIDVVTSGNLLEVRLSRRSKRAHCQKGSGDKGE